MMKDFMTSIENSDLIAEYEKYYTTWIKISTKRSNFGVRGIHSNWGKNWSMKRKTSVMRVTKPLR